MIAFGDKDSAKEIVITGNDAMQFDVKNFEVDAGSKVKLTLKNIGKVPKIAMGHNLVVLKKGISAIAFGQKALSAGANATNPLPDSVKGDAHRLHQTARTGRIRHHQLHAPRNPGPMSTYVPFPDISP